MARVAECGLLKLVGQMNTKLGLKILLWVFFIFPATYLHWITPLGEIRIFWIFAQNEGFGPLSLKDL